MAVTSRLRASLLEGRLRGVGRLAYATVLGTELAAQRAIDRLSRRGRDLEGVLTGRLTAVVKTFERPRLLRRLVASIRRAYPDLRVVVVDDSREPRPLPGVDTVVLPFDSGVSAGKNAGLAAVDTEYVLLLDDDFVFWRHTDLVRAVACLDARPEIDVLGGEVVYLPSFRANDYRTAGLYPTPATPTRPPGTTIDGMPILEKVANFYVARTERLRLVGWDPALKRLDHADFFTRARGVLTTVLDRDLRCLHAQDRFDRRYRAHRDDVEADRLLLSQRWFGDRWRRRVAAARRMNG
jgi:GT2 family glycosyltransferase